MGAICERSSWGLEFVCDMSDILFGCVAKIRDGSSEGRTSLGVSRFILQPCVYEVFSQYGPGKISPGKWPLTRCWSPWLRAIPHSSGENPQSLGRLSSLPCYDRPL